MNKTTLRNFFTQSQNDSTASASSGSSPMPSTGSPSGKEEILIESQFAFFFENPVVKPEELWQQINDKLTNIFDQTPVIIPVPYDPNLYDVPVVQMRSGNGIFRLNLARGRADFFYAGSGKQKFSDIQVDFTDKLLDLFAVFSDLEIKTKRIGFVTRFFIEDIEQDKTIKKLLIENFTSLFDTEVNEVGIRYVTRMQEGEFKLNNFTAAERFNARIIGEEKPVKGVLITRDFNTAPEENYGNKINAETLKNIINVASGKFKLDELKKILWPSV